MADELLSDADVFGGDEQLLSDADVFGAEKPGMIDRAMSALGEGRSKPDQTLSGITPEQARGITGEVATQPSPAAPTGLGAAVPRGPAKEAAPPARTKAELARELDDAEWRRADGAGLTAEQVGKDLLGGIEQVKSLGTGAAAFGTSASWRMADQALADMDAIDATGAPRKTKPSPMGASQVHPYVDAYRAASQEKRAAIRELVGQVLQRDEAFINDAAKAIKAYGEEQRRLSGKMPDFTDIRSVKGFAEWAVRNGVATAPTMAVSMVSALAGMPGLMAAGGAMAVGDMTSARIDHANQVLDPKRFRSADRAADAVAAQPGATARYLGENVGTTAALAVPYAALDRLGPAGTLATQGVKGAAAGGVRQVLARGAKEVGAEAINEGGQEAINIGSDMAALERGTDLTTEDAKRVVNAAAVGGLMGGAGHAANVAGDVVRGASPIAGFLTPRTKPDAPALPPTQMRTEALRRFDELAAQFGMNPKSVATAKQAASEMPAGEVPGFLGRMTEALQKRGMVSRPIDEQGLAGLSEALDGKPGGDSGKPGGDSSDDAKNAAVDSIEATLKAAGLLDEAITVPGLESATPDAPVEGEKINRNWSAFSPESGTLNIPRSQMPQIAAEHRGALVNFLNARGVSHEMATVDPGDLKPTQGEFEPKKVAAIAEKPSGRSLLVSADGHILDGHHQWLAARERGEPVRVVRLDADIQDLLRLAHQFPSSTVAKGPTRKAADDQPDLAAATGRPAGAADGGSVQPGGSGRDMGSVSAAPGTVDRPAESPAAGAGPAQTVADGSAADAALSSDQRTAAPVAESQAPARSADGDGGVAPTQAGSAPNSRPLGSYGRTPNGATPVELRPNADGTLTPWTGKYPMVDYESGDPISIPADASDAEAVDAIRAAKAIVSKDKFFGLKPPQSAAPAADTATPSTDAEPAESGAAPTAEQGPTRDERMAAARTRIDGLKALLACLGKA